MKNIFGFWLISLTCSFSMAQNLIPNHSFENYSNCPNGFGQIENAMHWINPSKNQNILCGSPDYFNSCDPGYHNVPNTLFGFRQARSGNAFCGIALWSLEYSNFREYIEVKLDTPLSANRNYYFEMFVNSPEAEKYITGSIGAYLSDTMITADNSLPFQFSPQIINKERRFDKYRWNIVSGKYKARGGEQFLTIGNFNVDDETDTSIVNPSGNPYAYFFIDDVLLMEIMPPTHTDNYVSIYPNPFFNQLVIKSIFDQPSQFILYDVTARKILSQQFSHELTINTAPYAEGIYTYEIRDASGKVKTGKVVKN